MINSVKITKDVMYILGLLVGDDAGGCYVVTDEVPAVGVGTDDANKRKIMF